VSSPLARLGESASESVAAALEALVPGQVTMDDVSVARGDEPPIQDFPVPLTTVAAAYAEGSVGGNVLVLTPTAARTLLGAAGESVSPDSPALAAGEENALAAAAAPVLGAVAKAIAGVLGDQVGFASATVASFARVQDAADAFPTAPHQLRIAFKLAGEPCRLVALVPNAIAVRLSDALDGMVGGHATSTAPVWHGTTAPAPSLDGISVRVSAELGRSELASSDLIGLPVGSVVELDRRVEEPIDLYANGHRYATGRLVVVGDGEWGVEIDAVHGLS
jgi:flagellar motor switch protein FliN